MKLLFDENLSPRLPTLLDDVFPQSAHVDRVGLGSAPDSSVWEYAKANGYLIVSKDSDFHESSLLEWLSSQSGLDQARQLLHAPS